MEIEIFMKAVGAFFLGLILAFGTGCMQITGAKRINAWGLEIEANSGFDVSAGVMQYDHSLERKGMNVEAKDNRRMEKY
jgi:hypothetical protein